jgi:hypothetical protein
MIELARDCHHAAIEHFSRTDKLDLTASGSGRMTLGAV